MLSQDTAQSANTPTSLAELKIATTLLWVKHLRLKHKPQTRRARRLTGTTQFALVFFYSYCLLKETFGQ